MSDELSAPIDSGLAVVSTPAPAIDTAAVLAEADRPKKLAEMASWDELVTDAPAESPAEAVAEPSARADGAVWDASKGQWRNADGTFAEGAAPEPVVADAAPAEEVVPEPTPTETVSLRTRDGGTMELEVDDPKLAELLRQNANDGMRAAQYREKVAALDAKLEEVNAFRAIMETNPEAVVLQHLPQDRQVSIAVSLIAQHWDALVPAIQALDSNPSDRITAAMKAQTAIRENQSLYEQKVSEGRYLSAVQSQLTGLVPEGTDEGTAARFLNYAATDLAQIIQRTGRVDPAQVPTLLAETVKLFGFAGAPAPVAPAKPSVRFAAAVPTPAVTSPTAARPVGDAAVALAKQAQARTAATQAARTRAAAVPPSGAGAAPVRLPPVPKGADIKTASQTLKNMGNSWGHLGTT